MEQRYGGPEMQAYTAQREEAARRAMAPGRTAFEAYNSAGATPGLTWDKKPASVWENLSEEERTKWAAVEAAAILNAIKDSVAYRIRALRRHRKLTLEDTANAMACTIPEASEIERGERGPTGEQLHALEKLFGEQI